MAPVAPRRRRARPVADAPIDGLLAHAEDLAKGWLLALLEQAPLERAPAIPSDALTRDGPRVCDAVLRALADEDDLRRLEPGGALRPLAARVGALAGAADGGPGAVSGAVDTLHGVLWAALRVELRGIGGPDPELVAQLAERLALVCELLREAALQTGEDGVGGGRGGSDGELSAVAPRAAGGPAPPDGGGPPGGGGPPAGGGPPPSVATDLASPAADPLWTSALQDEVRRAQTGAGPLSLLLAELEDADRLVASTTPQRAGTAFGEFAAALRSVVRRQDILVCETETRAWIIARETARAGAHSLGARLAEAVGETTAWGGAPLVASVGVAVLGEDGASAGELIEAAEEARFAASARGIEVSRRVPDEERRR